jgi:predicted dehydrogenase
MTVGIGMVGSGFMSLTYAYGITELVPEARLVAIHGGRRAPEYAARFGMQEEPTLDALLARSDVDMVFLGTPTQVHRDQTIQAAQAGKHVFTEKPIAATLPEIDAMIAACRDAGVKLGVNAVTRWRRGVRQAKALVERGEIGDVRMVRHTYAHVIGAYAPPGHWILQQAADSPFLDQGAHCNDAIRWIVGADAVSAYAQYASFEGTEPAGQSAMVQFGFANGAMCQIWASYEWPKPPDPDKWTGDYLFVGSTGMIDVQYRGTLRIHRGEGWETLYEHPPVQQPEPDVEFAYPYAEQVRDFIEAIREGREPEVNGEEARKGIEMALAADRSAATGEAVSIPLT